MQIKTVEEFIEYCNRVTEERNELIFQAFENACIDEVRDTVYGPYNSERNREPFRAAMHKLGFAEY